MDGDASRESVSRFRTFTTYTSISASRSGKRITRSVTALQTWAAGAEIEMGFFLHGAGRLATLTAQAIDHLAHETAETFEWLVHRHIPRWVKHA
jgi:hypothetical protein